MTTDELLRIIPLSRATVFRDLAALRIKPLGQIRTRPQRWPEDTARKIMERRGLVVATTYAGQADKGKTQLATLAQLRSERRKAKQSPRR